MWMCVQSSHIIKLGLIKTTELRPYFNQALVLFFCTLSNLSLPLSIFLPLSFFVLSSQKNMMCQLFSFYYTEGHNVIADLARHNSQLSPHWETTMEENERQKGTRTHTHTRTHT